MSAADPLPLAGATVALVLVFGFLSGFNDSSSLVAAMISSRALESRRALTLAAVFAFAGPFLFGAAVAATIGRGIVDPDRIGPVAILIAMGVTVGWSVLAAYSGLPTSSTHALIGSLVGGAIASAGPAGVHLDKLLPVVLALLAAPIVGLLLGFLALRLVLFLVRGATPRVNLLFKQGQIATSVILALSYGTNDAQKTVGMITLTLVVLGLQADFTVQPWVIAASAGALALGIATGGWRTIRTLGAKMYRIRPVHGLGATGAAAIVILGASLFGWPLSTSHVASSAILGAGSAERLSKVRWGVASQMAIAWLLTMPVTAGLAAALIVLLQKAGV